MGTFNIDGNLLMKKANSNFTIGEYGTTNYIDLRFLRGPNNNFLYFCGDSNGYGGVIGTSSDNGENTIYIKHTSVDFTTPLNISSNGIDFTVGPLNSGYVHFQNAQGKPFYFQHDVRVDGNIYAGTDFGKLVLTEENFSTYLNSHYVNVTGDTMTGSLTLGTAGTTAYLEHKIYRGAKNNRLYICGNNGNGGHLIVANDDSSSQIDFTLTQTIFNKPIQTSDLILVKNGKTSSISSNNSAYLHYSTNTTNGHYFNTDVSVNGNIYAGSGYSDLVLTNANYHGSLVSSRSQGSASGWHVVYINSTTAWMTAFTIRVYQAYKWSDIVISGYNYGSSYWYSPSAVMMNSSTVDSMTVYFGYLSANNLWVAIPASSYYGIDIIDCTNGYAAFDSWKDLFTLQYISGTATNKLPGTIQTYVTVSRPWHRGEAVTGAVWNDYAEYRESDCDEPGYVLVENGNDTLSKSTERLQSFAGISSDTWGFSQGKTDKAKTPIAVAGRVLAYTYQDRNNYTPGDCVCAAPGGTVDIMTREEVINWPDRVIGTVSCIPEYDEWGGGESADRKSVKINNRIWIKVK